MKRFLLGLMVTPFILNAAPAQTAEVVKEIDDNLKALRKEDEALRQAMAAHPDVMVATAKLRVAEAELAQVKLALSQKIAGLKVEIETRKAQLVGQETLLQKLNDGGRGVSLTERIPVQVKYTELKAGLTRLTAEYESLTKPASGSTSGVPYSVMLNRPQEGLATAYGQSPVAGDQWAGLATARWVNVPLVPGSPADKLKAVLDRPVKLDLDSRAARVVIQLLMSGLKSDVTVRMPYLEEGILKDTMVTAKGEMTLVPWLEFILDEVNTKLPTSAQNEAYVREYGLLITSRSSKPTDAITIRQFTDQVRAEKAAAELAKPYGPRQTTVEPKQP